MMCFQLRTAQNLCLDFEYEIYSNFLPLSFRLRNKHRHLPARYRIVCALGDNESEINQSLLRARMDFIVKPRLGLIS
jgi:hypothetical protein